MDYYRKSDYNDKWMVCMHRARPNDPDNGCKWYFRVDFFLKSNGLEITRYHNHTVGLLTQQEFDDAIKNLIPGVEEECRGYMVDFDIEIESKALDASRNPVLEARGGVIISRVLDGNSRGVSTGGVSIYQMPDGVGVEHHFVAPNGLGALSLPTVQIANTTLWRLLRDSGGTNRARLADTYGVPSWQHLMVDVMNNTLSRHNKAIRERYIMNMVNGGPPHPLTEAETEQEDTPAGSGGIAWTAAQTSRVHQVGSRLTQQDLDAFMRDMQERLFAPRATSRIGSGLQWTYNPPRHRVSEVAETSFTLQSEPEAGVHARVVDNSNNTITVEPLLTPQMTPIQKMKEVLRAKLANAAIKGEAMRKRVLKNRHAIIWKAYLVFLVVVLIRMVYKIIVT